MTAHSLRRHAAIQASLAAERPALLCYGCDAERPFRRAYCRSCEEVTDSYEYGTLSVPLVTAVAVDPTASRVFQLVTADRPLTAAEQAEVDAAEEAAGREWAA